MEPREKGSKTLPENGNGASGFFASADCGVELILDRDGRTGYNLRIAGPMLLENQS